MNVDREQALDVALGQIERQFGKGSVMRMSDQAAVAVGAVSTGSLALDLALGIGGLPRGRIVEVFGPEASGKTTLVYHVIAEALRQLAGTLNRTETICIFTNQLREKIGVMFGNPETTPGGRALKFYSSVRLDIRRIETLKEGVEAFGNRVRVKVVKNKVAPPFKQAEFDIIYGSGISWEGTVLDAALERKIVQKSGAYFSFEDERLGQGRHNATAFLREHPDVCQKILAGIQAQIGPDQIVSARLLDEPHVPRVELVEPLEDDAEAPASGPGRSSTASGRGSSGGSCGEPKRSRLRGAFWRGGMPPGQSSRTAS